MSGSIPKHRNRYKVAEAKQQMADKFGVDPKDPRIVIDEIDGEEFLVEHPMFRSAETKAALKPLAEDDSEGIARAVMGDEQYEKWASLGGDPEDLPFVFMQMQEDMQDTLAGRKRPTRS